MAPKTRSQTALAAQQDAEARAVSPHRPGLQNIDRDALELIGHNLGDDADQLVEKQPMLSVLLGVAKFFASPTRGPLNVLLSKRAEVQALCTSGPVLIDPWSLPSVRKMDLTGAAWDDPTSAHLATLKMLVPVFLELISIKIGDGGVKRLCEGMESGSLPSLQRLYVYGVGDDSASAVAEALHRGAMPKMGCLMLAQGSIGPVGLAALAGAIGDGMVPELRALDVRENNLGDQGCAALAAVLRKHKNLEGLNIRNNGIGNEGLAALVSESVDGEWPKLQILDVGKNQITNFGTLISAFDSGAFPALECLNLHYNLVERASRKEAEQAHKRRVEKTLPLAPGGQWCRTPAARGIRAGTPVSARLYENSSDEEQ